MKSEFQYRGIRERTSKRKVIHISFQLIYLINFSIKNNVDMLPIVSKTPVSKIKSSTFLEPKREVINGINSLFLKSFPFKLI